MSPPPVVLPGETSFFETAEEADEYLRKRKKEEKKRIRKYSHKSE